MIDKDEFRHGYMRAVLFACAYEMDDDVATDPHYMHQGEMGDTIEGYIAGLPSETREAMYRDADSFSEREDIARELEVYASAHGSERAGEVFAYSAAGHGVAFTDDGDGHVGRTLRDAVGYGEINLLVDGEDPAGWDYYAHITHNYREVNA